MATCTHLLGAMPCTNRDEHEGKGRDCTHESSTGSWVPDHHDATSGGEH